MIEERALVEALQGDFVILKMQRQSSCQSCEMSGGCGTGSLGRLLGFKTQNLSIRNQHKLKVGDQIIIGMPEKSYVAAGFLMYLLPLINLFIFGVLSNYLFGGIEWVNVVAALTGLAMGLYFSVSLSNKFFAENMTPHFVRHEFPVQMGELNSVYSVH